MKYNLYILLLSIFSIGCKQNNYEDDYEYRETSYRFLRLVGDGEFDLAKDMFIVIPEELVSIDSHLKLTKRFLSEHHTIPPAESYILDSIEIQLGKRRAYEIELFKNDETNISESFIGSIRIEFREGMPEKISTISVIGKPVEL